MYQMLLQVAAGTRFFATTAEVNITYTASVAAVASTTAIAVRGLMADMVVLPILVEHDLFGKPVSTFPDHALKTGSSSRHGCAQSRAARRSAVRRHACD